MKEREARGQKCLEAAREARFNTNGEPESAPTMDDAVKEREITNRPVKGKKKDK
jgi:hypothetical protein